MSGQRFPDRLRWFALWCALGLCVLGLLLRAELGAENGASEVVSDAPISIAADYATEGKTEDGQRVLILRGHRLSRTNRRRQFRPAARLTALGTRG